MLQGDIVDMFYMDDMDNMDNPASPYPNQLLTSSTSPYLQESKPYPPSPYLQESKPYPPSPYLQESKPYPPSPYLQDVRDLPPYPESPYYPPEEHYYSDPDPLPWRDPNKLYSHEIDPDNVKHVADVQVKLRKYVVKLGDKITRRGQLFDTAEVKKHFRRPERDPSKAKVAGAWLLRPGASQQEKEQFRPIHNEWNAAGLIWVYADLERMGSTFMSHVGKPGRFHHSSFVSGGSVRGAGEWIVDDGKLTHISANSGHYQPTLDFLYKSVLAMSEALHEDTQVLLWDKHEKKYTYVPANDFLDDPGSGRYAAHYRQA